MSIKQVSTPYFESCFQPLDMMPVTLLPRDTSHICNLLGQPLFLQFLVHVVSRSTRTCTPSPGMPRYRTRIHCPQGLGDIPVQYTGWGYYPK